MAVTYDLSSLSALENVVAQMVRDDATSTQFAGGDQDAETAVAGGPAVGTTSAGRFTATFGNAASINVQQTAVALRDRLRALILVVEQLTF